jgi:hypothetical protein
MSHYLSASPSKHGFLRDNFRQGLERSVVRSFAFLGVLVALLAMGCGTASTAMVVDADGSAPDGSSSLRSPPRPLAPLSTSSVTSQRPTLRWLRGTMTDIVELRLCRDRALTVDCRTERSSGERWRSDTALSAGWWFWQLARVINDMPSAERSAVWQFYVGKRSADDDRDSSFGSALDLNGDGAVELALGSPGADRKRGRVDIYDGRAASAGGTPTVTLAGASEDDQFGQSVASAGDVNGDGFADLVVGAPLADGNDRRNSGSISIYLGGPSGISARPQRVLAGEDHYEFFGASVAGVGDVNGDGYADIVAGAPGATIDGMSDSGLVRVYWGSAEGIAARPSSIVRGATGGERFGDTVSALGDVNGDGMGDFAVAAPNSSPGGRRRAGAVSIFVGRTSGPVMMPHRTLEGRMNDDQLGRSMSGAGDVNGDGFSDMLIRAVRPDPGDSAGAGEVYLYLGENSGISATPHRVWIGATAGESLGQGLAFIGDVNGDGFDDIAMGAPRAAPGGRRDAGEVRVYRGSSAGVEAMAHRVIEGAMPSALFGGVLANVGDINADGFADLVVGSPLASPTGRMEAGTVMIFLGSSMGLSSTAQRTFEGSASEEQLGGAIAMRLGLRMPGGTRNRTPAAASRPFRS